MCQFPALKDSTDKIPNEAANKTLFVLQVKVNKGDQLVHSP